MGRFVLMLAFPAMCANGGSVASLIAAGTVTLLLLCIVDAGRGIRSKPSGIMARFMVGVGAFVFIAFYVLGNTAASRTHFTFADCFVISFWITVIVTVLFWTCLWFGTLIVRNDPDYQQWARAGGHYFWDSLPRILNPDSELIRNGGFAEPTYSGFVPPENWNHQCPQCGSRVQHAVDVCWRCNYGHDGDSTAYFERYGR